MAKSKYLEEFEKFKSELPSKILDHAEINGIDLCSSGLQAFFDDLGIEWEPERKSTNIRLSFNLNLPVDSSVGEPTKNGYDEVDTIVEKIRKVVSEAPGCEQDAWVDVDEVYCPNY